MIGASIYIPGPEDNIGLLARHLLIPPQNICAYGVARPNFDFYAREENSMTYAPVGGDFGYLCDVDLFHITREALIEMLRLASVSGPMLAIPDEKSDDPDVAILFESGTITTVQITKDDLLDEVRILRAGHGGA
jgi:hypothetical protein